MSRPRRNPLGLLLDNPWAIVGLAIVVAFTVWALGTRKQDHHVQANFASAFNLVPGQAVSVNGLEVGKIGKVKYDGGKALVEIGINDKRYWPLHEGTKVVSRWGTTIGSGTRRLDLIPGPTANKSIGEEGIIPTADTQAAVDVDQVLNLFNKNVRADLTGWMGNMDTALDGHAKQMNDGIRTAHYAVDSAHDLVNDLTVDTMALRSFISNAHKVTATLAPRSSQVEDLLTVAAETFKTFADNTNGVQKSIEDLAPTLKQARTTLIRVDGSIGTLDKLVAALDPGAKRLAPLARQATPALASLRQTVPDALSVVSRLTTASPHINALLTAATPFAQTAPGVFNDLSPMIACIRPYAPELGGALVGAGGAHQNFDKIDPKLNPQIIQYIGKREANGLVEQHGLRATPMVSEASLESGSNPAAFAAISGKQYAYPRPPGLTTAQPWFLPECGVTKDALDPSKDPEQRKR